MAFKDLTRESDIIIKTVDTTGGIERNNNQPSPAAPNMIASENTLPIIFIAADKEWSEINLRRKGRIPQKFNPPTQ
jgi:hypothetical protein